MTNSLIKGVAVYFLLGACLSSKKNVHAFSLLSSPSQQTIRGGVPAQHTASTTLLFASSIDGTTAPVVDPNTYNVDLETAVDLMTASVQPENSIMRDAGIPFIDVTSKDYFVDDVDIIVSREGGMGLELLELAGGREDGFGITVVTKVSGNAANAGVLPGDSIAAVTIISSTALDKNNVEESTRVAGCECLDFDRTMEVLANFPGDAPEVILSVKRIRRWPKLKVTVEYPPIQVADGADNKVELELVAGENLKRALQTRGIVLEDPSAGKCDFCGGKCTVSVTKGMKLLSVRSTTEAKIMAKNPTCRLSCKTIIGPNMEEGEVRLKVNVRQWNQEKK